MRYEIFIADIARTNILQLPILPPELPAISKSIANEEFATFKDGSINFINDEGLYTTTLESFFPVHDYSFAASNNKANEFLELLNGAIKRKEPIILVIVEADGNMYINDKFSIEGFEYKANKVGDYNYTLTLKKYVEYSTSNVNYKKGWNKDSVGWWYVVDVDKNIYYKNTWQLINNEWYYFNEKGYALENKWLLWENIWYWMDGDCKMTKSKWLKINGKWYCFNNEGALYVDCKTPDGYVVDIWSFTINV